LAQARKSLEAAEAAGEEQEELLEQIERAVDRERDLRKESKTAEADVRSAESALAAAKARANAAREAVPDELRKPGAVEKQIDRSKRKLESLEKASDAATKAATQAGTDLAARDADLTTAKAQVTEAHADAESALKAFQGRVADAGFDSVEDYQKAKLPPESIATLAGAVAEHDKQLTAAKDRQERAAKDTEGLQPPDTARLKQEADTAREEVVKAAGAQATLKQTLETVEARAKQLEKIAEQVRKIDAEHGVVGRLAEVATGGNVRRINFQRYVQAMHLDRVLHRANERLRSMTGARYSLYRAEEEEDRRVAGGLNIVVLDHLTQKMRPVSTLSGGETFQASLSLALGLADTVTSQSGGVKLDTIFVDEGFGSLDSDALDLAIQTLQTLERAGRTVGIISHVPELRERFAECRLQVTPGGRGSRAEFVVA
jgi:exonuclease SbcC